MNPLMFDFPFPSLLGKSLRDELGIEEGIVFTRPFPDGETYLRIETPVKDEEVIINATLFHPNDWFLSLTFLADALRAQGAKRVGLLAPYLAYMRQDTVFQPGEALSSVTFARLLSSCFDYLITVDPHLHRYHNLNEIYTIPTYVLKAAPLISKWIHANVKDPFVIGPDSESAQWVNEISNSGSFLVLTKTRDANGQVTITCPQIEDIESKNIVLFDDIISSGGTMFQALQLIRDQGARLPICITIHPVFAENSYQKLLVAGAQKIITCNSIPHPSNQIDLSPLLIPTLKEQLGL